MEKVQVTSVIAISAGGAGSWNGSLFGPVGGVIGGHQTAGLRIARMFPMRLGRAVSDRTYASTYVSDTP